MLDCPEQDALCWEVRQLAAQSLQVCPRSLSRALLAEEHRQALNLLGRLR